jgi:hypothetical protein
MAFAPAHIFGEGSDLGALRARARNDRKHTNAAPFPQEIQSSAPTASDRPRSRSERAQPNRRRSGRALSVAPVIKLCAGVASVPSARAPWRRPLGSRARSPRIKTSARCRRILRTDTRLRPLWPDRLAGDCDRYPAADAAGVGRAVSATPPGGALRARARNDRKHTNAASTVGAAEFGDRRHDPVARCGAGTIAPPDQAKPISAAAPFAQAPAPALESANNNSGKKRNIDGGQQPAAAGAAPPAGAGRPAPRSPESARPSRAREGTRVW